MNDINFISAIPFGYKVIPLEHLVSGIIVFR